MRLAKGGSDVAEKVVASVSKDECLQTGVGPSQAYSHGEDRWQKWPNAKNLMQLSCHRKEHDDVIVGFLDEPGFPNKPGFCDGRVR